MILVDTSVWIAHFRVSDGRLRRFLLASRAIAHPFAIGEIALGSLRDRRTVLEMLGFLPAAIVADHAEVMAFIDQYRLDSRGIGCVSMPISSRPRGLPRHDAVDA
jgi:predicted nucleic acid-binding protein